MNVFVINLISVAVEHLYIRAALRNGNFDDDLLLLFCGADLLILGIIGFHLVLHLRIDLDDIVDAVLHRFRNSGISSGITRRILLADDDRCRLRSRFIRAGSGLAGISRRLTRCGITGCRLLLLFLDLPDRDVNILRIVFGYPAAQKNRRATLLNLQRPVDIDIGFSCGIDNLKPGGPGVHIALFIGNNALLRILILVAVTAAFLVAASALGCAALSAANITAGPRFGIAFRAFTFRRICGNGFVRTAAYSNRNTAFSVINYYSPLAGDITSDINLRFIAFFRFIWSIINNLQSYILACN